MLEMSLGRKIEREENLCIDDSMKEMKSGYCVEYT